MRVGDGRETERERERDSRKWEREWEGERKGEWKCVREIELGMGESRQWERE